MSKEVKEQLLAYAKQDWLRPKEQQAFYALILEHEASAAEVYRETRGKTPSAAHILIALNNHDCGTDLAKE